MMKGRKIVVVALGFLLLLSAVVTAEGQAEKKDSGGPVELTLWQGTGQLNATFEEFIAEFENDNPGVTINLELSPGSEMLTKLIPALASGQGPELVTGNQQWYTPLVEQQLCYPIPEDVISDAVMKAEYIEGADVGVSFGKRFAVPTGVMAPVLYVNTEMLAEAGIDSLGSTWDEVLDNTEKLAVWNGDNLERAGLCLISAKGEANMLFSLVYQQGGEFFSDDGKKSFLDTPEVLNAVRLARDVYDRKINKVGFPPAQDAFANGKAAAAVMWTWYGSYLNANYPDLQWSATKMPRFEDSGPYGRCNALSALVFVTKKTTEEKLDEAWAFWKYVSVENNARFAKAEGTVPQRKDGINADWIDERIDLVVLREQLMDPQGGYIFPVAVPQPILDYLGSVVEATIITENPPRETDAIRQMLRRYEEQLNQHLMRRNYPFSPEA